ncbi:MAG: thioredoxin family protein [Treponemataceae bacterium]|nr:thioredoxin family protein [Treponemataceae bacterium]
MEKGRLAARIAAPVLIAAAVVGIWFAKHRGAADDGADGGSVLEGLPERLRGADFSFEQTAAVDFAALAEFGIPFIMDFGSEDCPPCRRMAPDLRLIHDEYTGRAFVKYLDVWKYPAAADGLPLQVIPTQFFFLADGSPFVPDEALSADIPFLMYSSRETGGHTFTAHQGGLSAEELRRILAAMGAE